MMMYDTREDRQNFYQTREWINLRLYHLQNEPLCRKCKENNIIKAANIVDHIIDLKDAPELALIDTNLQSLCEKCHNQKTMKKTMKEKNSNKTRKLTLFNRKWKI